MRVLQLIDSLRPGGAERMAVNYANALATRIDGSYLCCTRMEGLLKDTISAEVGFLFLGKKHVFDIKAFGKLRSFILKNDIDIIQAHSSSWFLALQMKLSLPKLKLVWHDHYGKELTERKTSILKFASGYFDGIISVNSDLKSWAESNLQHNSVRFLSNFIPLDSYSPKAKVERKIEKINFELKGKSSSFKIICLANFRPQKDQITLIKGFELLLKENENISLHLVGKDFEDSYSAEITKYIQKRKFHEKIFIYGEQQEVMTLLNKADLGILASISEGMPVSLLEYGFAGLAVVSTDVGECRNVLGNYGLLVPPNDSLAIKNAIFEYLGNKSKRQFNAEEFQKRIFNNYSEDVVVPQFIEFCREL